MVLVVVSVVALVGGDGDIIDTLGYKFWNFLRR